MTAPKLARVDDVIAHGEAIPANVRVVADRNGEVWERIGQFTFDRPHRPGPVPVETLPRREGPLMVVKVDPEPQPAEAWDMHEWCACKSLATPGPQVFEVPQAPPGVTRVTFTDGEHERWAELNPEPPNPNYPWRADVGNHMTWGMLLARFEQLIDATPPRKPRTWQHLDRPPLTVDVEGYGRWTREGDAHDLYARLDINQPHAKQSLLTLMKLGNVTEVFDA